MAKFAKNEDCPASQDLLAFQNGDMPTNESVFVRRHLAECEFCSSEVEFYSHYPPAEINEEITTPAEMPEHLFDLAQAIFKNH